MNGYDICTDFIEIITGAKSKISPVYQEAANSVDKDGKQAVKKLKGFIVSIEEVSSKDTVKDTRISSTRGNVKNFSGYNNITEAMNFLKKHLSSSDVLKDLDSIHDALISNVALYTEAYEKNVKLIMLEYENAVYMLVTGIVFTMVNNIDISSTNDKITVKSKAGSGFNVINKNIREFAKEISSKNHKTYIQELTKQTVNMKVSTDIKESVVPFTEANAISILKLIGTLWDTTVTIGRSISAGVRIVKNSLFGIVPLIRSILYLRYKKKADTILALDEQVVFVQRNIEQLQNKSNMDPKKKEEIIKKQQAMIEMYRKKSEKLRAQLIETEKEAATELKSADEEIRNSNDDDFILEMVGFHF